MPADQAIAAANEMISAQGQAILEVVGVLADTLAARMAAQQYELDQVTRKLKNNATRAVGKVEKLLEKPVDKLLFTADTVLSENAALLSSVANKVPEVASNIASVEAYGGEPLFNFYLVIPDSAESPVAIVWIPQTFGVFHPPGYHLNFLHGPTTLADGTPAVNIMWPDLPVSSWEDFFSPPTLPTEPPKVVVPPTVINPPIEPPIEPPITNTLCDNLYPTGPNPFAGNPTGDLGNYYQSTIVGTHVLAAQVQRYNPLNDWHLNDEVEPKSGLFDVYCLLPPGGERMHIIWPSGAEFPSPHLSYAGPSIKIGESVSWNDACEIGSNFLVPCSPTTPPPTTPPVSDPPDSDCCDFPVDIDQFMAWRHSHHANEWRLRAAKYAGIIQVATAHSLLDIIRMREAAERAILREEINSGEGSINDFLGLGTEESAMWRESLGINAALGVGSPGDEISPPDLPPIEPPTEPPVENPDGKGPIGPPIGGY